MFFRKKSKNSFRHGSAVKYLQEKLQELSRFSDQIFKSIVRYLKSLCYFTSFFVLEFKLQSHINTASYL